MTSFIIKLLRRLRNRIKKEIVFCDKCYGLNIRQIPPEEFFGDINNLTEEEEKFGFYSILECIDCKHRMFDF